MKILLSGFCLLSFLSLSAQDSLTILFAGDAMMHQKQLDNTRRGDFLIWVAILPILRER